MRNPNDGVRGGRPDETIISVLTEEQLRELWEQTRTGSLA